MVPEEYIEYFDAYILSLTPKSGKKERSAKVSSRCSGDAGSWFFDVQYLFNCKNNSYG